MYEACFYIECTRKLAVLGYVLLEEKRKKKGNLNNLNKKF